MVHRCEPSCDRAVRGLERCPAPTSGGAAAWGGVLAALSFKTGRLRLVDASPEAYRERAHLDVLNPGAVNYVWPVFADGTIFVRDQEEMVAVAVGDEPSN